MKRFRYLSRLCAGCLALTGMAAGFPAALTAYAEEYNGLTYIIYDDTVRISGYTKDLPEDVVIPAEIDGLPVTEVGGFDMCTTLKSVTIEAPITTVSLQAFRYCEKLTSVVLPDTVTEIERYAFAYCPKLTSITWPPNLETIGEGAFLRCTHLEDVEIPESVTKIGADVFQYTAWLNAQRELNPLVIIRDTLVDAATFEGDLVIPDEVTKIGGKAFD